MKTRINILILLTFCWVILASCSNEPHPGTSDLETQFSKIVPVADMNKSLRIIVDGKENTFGSDTKIPLLLYNKSKYSLFFANNSHVKLLAYINNEWTEVENGITYSGELVLAPQGTPLLDTGYTFIHPIFDKKITSTRDKDIMLRIVILGNILKGEIRTDKNVAAFVDVQITP